MFGTQSYHFLWFGVIAGCSQRGERNFLYFHSMKSILIAGGTGAIGRALTAYLTSKGNSVKILSRNPKRENEVRWSPAEGIIDTDRLRDVQVIVNLSGAGIDEKRWTKSRKQELFDSRILSTKVLVEHAAAFPLLEHYISASGITAYGFDDGETEHPESDAFGTDFISTLVQAWENAADLFEAHVPVTKLRIAVVLNDRSGALPKLAAPIKWGLGAPIGSGRQQVPWVHITDLIRQVEWVMDRKLTGVYNTNAGNVSNAQLTKAVARALHKRLWMPNVPSFAIKLLFGQVSEILLSGAKASNATMRTTGFEHTYTDINSAVDDLLKAS